MALNFYKHRMTPNESPQDNPADEYTGNYGRGGYYGYTYDQDAYNRQVRRALKTKKAGHPQDPAAEDKKNGDEKDRKSNDQN